MTEPTPAPPLFDLPPPHIRAPRRWRVSLIWLVPAVAVIAGLVLAVRSYLQAGPSITIQFDTAEGIDPGKTAVRFKNVDIGKVQRIELSEDHDHVIVTVDLIKDAARLAVADTRFWVVRPRVDFGGISGMNTLLSGAYIGIDVGKSDEPQRRFMGLEKPPAITNDQQGRRFILHADDLGSLNISSPVYFHRIGVGRVVGFDLNPDGRGVTLQIFIDAPYDTLVHKGARFWNASGVEVSLGALGIKVNTESLATVIAGGLAFDSMTEDAKAEVASPDTEFQLFTDKATALAPADGESIQVHMNFPQSMKGLEVGAPVEFEGVTLGEVTRAELHYDAHTRDFYVDVMAKLYPQRLGPAYPALLAAEHDADGDGAAVFGQLIRRGLRAQLQIGNIVTEKLFIALNFMPRAKAVSVDARVVPLEIPTAPGTLQQAQQQVLDILRKLDTIPFDEIGTKTRDLLVHVDSLVQQFDGKLAPEAEKMLQDARSILQSANQNLLAPDAPLQQDTRQTLEQLQQAARSLRALSDYLGRHPQSVLLGQPRTGPLPAPEPEATLTIPLLPLAIPAQSSPSSSSSPLPGSAPGSSK